MVVRLDGFNACEVHVLGSRRQAGVVWAAETSRSPRVSFMKFCRT